MPILELPDLHLPEAGVYLFAVMIGPKRAPAEHCHFVQATRNTAILNVASQIDGSQVRPEGIPDIVAAATGPNLENIARIYTPDLLKGGYIRGDMAGRLLMFVLACAEHQPANANLEHAYRTFAKAFGHAKMRGGSRAYLAKVWADYGPVSHLWCARRGGELPDGGKELAEFLGEQSR